MAAKKYSYDLCVKEALKYHSIKAFYNNARGHYEFASRHKFLHKIIAHCKKSIRSPYSINELKELALQYNKKIDFAYGNGGAYSAALKRGILNDICQHMPKDARIGAIPKHKKWTKDSIIRELPKYKTRYEFKKALPGAYKAATQLKLLYLFNTYMGVSNIRVKIPHDNLAKEALKYNTRSEFFKNNQSYYTIASKRNILDDICAHMKKAGNRSIVENDLFKEIKIKYPKVQKLRDSKVNIPNKPHIKGFDIDMYIPELRKGIEFDGTYWHSVEGLKRSRKNWPEEDLENYHILKDEHFKKRGIYLLHISEAEWRKDRNQSLNKIWNFLENK